MAFNGTGTFLRLYSWATDKINSIPITASRVDAEMDGMATGLSNCITKDGQTTISANIPLNSFKLTGLGSGTARTDAITVGQVQDNQFLYLGTTSGTADAYTLAPSPAITAYTATQQFTAKISATNLTTTPYLQVSSIASPATTAVIKKLSATKTEIAVEASDLLINGIYDFKRNSANDAWIVLNPEKAFYNFTNGSAASTTNKGIAFLSNPITISNNATDANNDIDFSAGNGVLDDGSGQVLLSSTLVKRLDASWVAGTNQGGLFSGTKAINTWYYLFAIVNTTTGATDAGFDTSVSGANVPSGWKISKILHAIRTDGSGNILNGTFLKDGWFYFNTSQSEYTTTSTVATNITLSYTPAISSLGHVSTNSVNSGATGVRQTFIGLLSTNLIIGGGVTYGDTYACRENGQMPIPANRSVYVQTAGTGTSTIRTHGFKPLI